MADSRALDLPTVAAIGLAVFGPLTVLHEGMGHGLACIALGSHVRQISTVHLDCDESLLSPWAMRAVFAAGTLANLLLAIAFATAARGSKRAAPSLRYFLWLAAVLNGLSAGGYLMTSPIFGFGDWTGFVEGLSYPWVWRISLSAAGVAIGLVALRLGARTLEPFLGTGDDRRRRAFALTVTPYLAAGVLGSIGGYFNPRGLLVMALVASFAGHCWLVWMPFSWLSRTPPPGEPLPLPRSIPWIVTGALVALVFIVVFAPGLPRG